jgi:hypothetical protein
MPGTIENLRELAKDYASSAQEDDLNHIKRMRAEMINLVLDRQILENVAPMLEEKGYQMSGVMDTLDRGTRKVDGVALMFKRREVMHSDFWYGQLIWIGVTTSTSKDTVALSVHHSQWPGLIHFDPRSGPTDEQKERFKRHLGKAIETPGRFEWYEGMASERYIYA